MDDSDPHGGAHARRIWKTMDNCTYVGIITPGRNRPVL